jgi:7 transmembrane receptor (rhodopsin family)
LILNIQQQLNVVGGLSCRFQGFLIDMAICQVLYSHCVASFCRLVAIVYATKHLFRSSAFTWICMGSGWLVSTLIAIPYLFLDGFACPSDTQSIFLSYYTIVMTFVLPMTIVGICNFRILRFVRQSTRQVHAEAPKNKATHARDIQLMKTLIGTFVLIVVGWSPIFLLETLVKAAVLPIAVNIGIQILPSVSMLLDVCVLIYTNQPVRLFLKQLILRKSPQPNLTNTH